MARNRPTHHHYVPCFHLARFTMSGEENGSLFVLDRTDRRMWGSTPLKTARKRDAYLVEDAKLHTGEAVDPSFVEQNLANALEGPCKLVFDKIEKDLHTPPPGPELNTLINYVASLITRVPFSRRLTDTLVDERFRAETSAVIKTEGGWKQWAGYLAEAGLEATDATRRAFIRSLDEAEVQIELDQTTMIVLMLEQTKQLLLPLARRHWSVRRVAQGGPDLVCSDCPVAITWNTDEIPRHRPMFDSAGAILSVPISRRTALVSRLDLHPELGEEIDERRVAELNSATMLRAGQVYASKEEFFFMDNSGQVESSRSLLRSKL